MVNEEKAGIDGVCCRPAATATRKPASCRVLPDRDPSFTMFIPLNPTVGQRSLSIQLGTERSKHVPTDCAYAYHSGDKHCK